MTRTQFGSMIAMTLAAALLAHAAPAEAKKMPAPPVELGRLNPPVLDAAGAALVKKARKATGKKALAAWAKVQAIDPDHSEARFGIAAAYVKLKQPTEAITALTALAGSIRTDAIEFLVEARTAKAFKRIAGDAAFIAAVGIGRATTEPYELLMGRGAAWSTPRADRTDCTTSEDRPDVDLTFKRDRTFALTGIGYLQGDSDSFNFKLATKGTWRIAGAGVELTFAKTDDPFTTGDVATCTFGTVTDGSMWSLSQGTDKGVRFDNGLICATPEAKVSFAAAPVSVKPRLKPKCSQML